MLKKIALPLVATALLQTASPVAAQNFPTQPIQIVVPFDAGGANDLAARAIQPALTKALGQPVVVLNKPGAGGGLGVTEVMRARPDGYTLLMLPSNNLIYEPNFKKTAYDVETFDYICRIFVVPITLAISPSAPFKDVPGMLKFAKENPAKLLYGTPAIGGINHVSLLALQKATGTQMTRVPFQGAAPAMQALASGQIHVSVDTPTTIVNANLKPAAVFTHRRAPETPDTPTFRELGIDLIEFVGFAGLVTPKGLPAPVRAALETACATTMKDPEALATLQRLNLRPDYLDAGAYKSNAALTFKVVGDALKEAGIVAQ